jgi:hypothetical protein
LPWKVTSMIILLWLTTTFAILIPSALVTAMVMAQSLVELVAHDECSWLDFLSNR